MIGHMLGRLILVPIGLVLAGFVTASVLVLIGQERLTLALRAAPEDAVFGMLDLFLKLGSVLLTPVMVVVPLLIAIAGEVARIRSAAFYVACFGAFAALLPILARIEAVSPSGVPVWAIFATAGFVGGATYWLIAGRRAGTRGAG